MSRHRQKQEESLFIEVLEFASQLPWWGVLVVAALSYGFLAFFMPFFFHSLESTSEALSLASGIFSQLSHTFAPYIAGFIVLTGIVGHVRRWADGRMLDAQSGVASLRELGWQEFERLLAAAYQREGFRVERARGNGPDGGVDLRLFRDGALVLVQCKHWRTWKVGVKIVRELRGVVASEGANGGIVVTSGAFTADAVDFARVSGIKLVDGEALLTMIRAVQGASSGVAGTSHEASGIVPPVLPTAVCPACGGPMNRKVARRGAHVGRAFLSCVRFPDCRGKIDLG